MYRSEGGKARKGNLSGKMNTAAMEGNKQHNERGKENEGIGMSRETGRS